MWVYLNCHILTYLMLNDTLKPNSSWRAFALKHDAGFYGPNAGIIHQVREELNQPLFTRPQIVLENYGSFH